LYILIFILFQLPSTPEEWLVIEQGFKQKFPRCVGAIDGKHIVIESPAHSGSKNFNYRGTFSIVLMALVDSDYRFIFADIGGQGRISDGGIFQHTLLWQKITNDSLNFPPESPLPGRDRHVPYVFIADGAFALHNKHVLKPFPGDHDIGTAERTFNTKLASSRVIVENVFGVLTSVYRIFKKPIAIDVKNVKLITMTCILLHNFLRTSQTSRNIYTPPGTFDSLVHGQIVHGSWRQNHTESPVIRAIPPVARRSPASVSDIRNEFANYFHNIE
jgi:Plant transposon protein.